MDESKSPELSQEEHKASGPKEPMGEIRSLERRLIELKREVIRTSSGVLSDVAEDDELTLLLVESAGRYYAVPIFVIDEVLQMPRLDDIGHGYDHIAGLINYHGQTLAALDLSIMLGGEQTRLDADKVVVICQVGSRRFGIVVEDALEVITVEPDALRTTEEVLPGLLKAAGVVRIGDEGVASVLEMTSLAMAAELQGTDRSDGEKQQ